jgi:predicted P-loop ATPase/GTPase
MATDEINNIVGTSKKVIDECIRKLLKEMDALY